MLRAGIAGVEERHDGVDAVVHLAAIPAPGIVPDTVLITQNLTMTINVFQAARRAGVKRIVHASSETLLGIRDFLPFFKAQSMDVAIIDAIWNGVWQSMKIANLAEAHEVNIAPHNFYGHLCSFINNN